MSSADYHNHRGTYSSSQIKTMEEDEEEFHAKYITREIPRAENAVFDVGNYFHSGVLEPEKIKEQCAVFTGIRRGKAWEEFKVKHKDKAIVTESELIQAKTLISAVENSPIAMARLKQGRPEVSCFSDVVVSDEMVFSSDGKRVLGKYGWEEAGKRKINPKNMVVIPLKVRADSLAPTFVLDLKSTTGNAKNKHFIKTQISRYKYDLSAAMYLDVFSLELERTMDEFVWTFASKEKGNCRSYIAELDMILIGRAKWKRGVMKLAEMIQCNWEFEDYMDTVGPEMYQYEHIKSKGEELL